MTREEALEILSVSRPNGQDDSDPLVAEALAMAKADPELQTWLEKERAMDLAISAKLATFPVPQGLKEQILGESKIVKTPFFRRPPVWAAMAAALVVMIGLSWTQLSSPSPQLVAFENYHREILDFANSFRMLPHHSSDLQNIQDWLAQSDSPSGFVVPQKLDAMTALGCRSIAVEGNKVSLVCFKLLDGKTEAHLFVVDRAMIENAPPEKIPLVLQKAGWTTASWSDAQHVYILASPTDPATLKTLL